MVNPLTFDVASLNDFSEFMISRTKIYFERS